MKQVDDRWVAVRRIIEDRGTETGKADGWRLTLEEDGREGQTAGGWTDR